MAEPAAAAPPRGFGVDRSDGRPPLPGSLHANRRLGQWLGFGADGRVLVRTGKVELGQGLLTALQLIAAEELDLPLSQVQVLSASTAEGPDEGVTSGSLSVQDSGGALRQACAELRALALQAAAARNGVPVDTLTVRDGRLHDAQHHDLGGYADLLQGTDLMAIECSGVPRPKPSAAHRLLGGRAGAPRLDLADKVFGRARFIHDLRPPGLRHARVLHPPTLDALPGEGLATALATLPAGVTGWVDGRWIALVADSERAVDGAAERLASTVDWQAGAQLPDEHGLHAFLTTAPTQDTVVAERGDAPWPAANEPGLVHEAVYLKPYLAHASIGPSCALAQWDGAQLQVWTHSQGIHNLRDDLARALSLAREAIVVRHVEGAGCYGHNGADDVALDAALVALRCTGAPVRVLWSRAAELAHSPSGPAQRVALRARLDADGRLTHWQHEHWSNGYSTRPGRAATPALLAAAEREQATPLPLAVNAPMAAGGGAERNAVPAYRVPQLQVRQHRLTVMPLRTSAMRALGAYANVFAIESFVDELARARGEDPLAFRRRHLDDPRALAVLDAVTTRSRWWGGRAAEPEGIGHGLAWARYKNTGAWCAVIARVQVSDRVRALALDLAVDVGQVVDLDGVVNQFEGGAIQATSWTLLERLRFDRQRITSVDWPGYPVLRFADVPEVTVHVLDRPEQPPLGAGEAAQGPVAAALANAVHDALGVRVRELPLDADALLRAVHADGGATR
ncbi:MAG: molybdopterin cofactor-binding domain-containing protein [Rubrivivax sp.]